MDDVIEERCKADPQFAADWEAQRIAREFAITVIRFRTEQGLSQDELAKAVFVQRHIISHLEIGEQNWGDW